MVWVKKPAAPDYANLANKVATLIAGGPDAWVLPWFSLVPGNVNMDVAAFCALGPPPEPSIDALDFLSFVGGGRFSAGVSTAQLAEKLSDWAFVKLFEAYCQEELAGGTHCVVFEPDILMSTGGQTWAPPRLFPAGAVTLKITCIALSTNGTHDMHVYWSVGTGYLSETVASSPLLTAVGQVQTHTIPATATTFQISTNGAGQRVKLEFCGLPGTVNDFTPTPIVEPPTAIPPDPGIYTTIPDLGAKLDDLQAKLHWVLSYVEPAAVARFEPLVADEMIPIDVPDTDVPLGPDVMGVIVTIDDIRENADERFGEPRQLHNIGRVVLGNGEAWLPPIEIAVSPMLILKPDPTITAVRVQTFPPTIATVTTLVRAAPVG